MRHLRSWWYAFAALSRSNPPQLVEAIMLSLALIVFVFWWILQDWQYLVLYLSYILGAIASILVREIIRPSAETTRIRAMAIISLLLLLSGVSIYTSQTLQVA